MKRRLLAQQEQTEINVSPDRHGFYSLIFIVATSFVNEIGISSTYKDSASPNSSTLNR